MPVRRPIEPWGWGYMCGVSQGILMGLCVIFSIIWTFCTEEQTQDVLPFLLIEALLMLGFLLTIIRDEALRYAHSQLGWIRRHAVIYTALVIIYSSVYF